MKVSEAIESRRSVKAFDPEHVMPQAEVDRLLELAKLTPTAFNLQHYRFVLVRDGEHKQQIRAHSWNQAQVTDCSLLIILCADMKAWEKNAERSWQTMPSPMREKKVGAIQEYYNGKQQVQRDEALRSCGMVAQTIMLAAREMGYDTCPMDGFDFDAVGKDINLPEDHLIAMFVAVGKRLEDPKPKPYLLPANEIVINERF